MEFYEDAEDSWLLEKCVKEHADLQSKNVLEIGTGSGYIANALANHANLIIASDINKHAIRYATQKKHSNVFFLIGDKISWLRFCPFHIIVFNPPYLPYEDIKETKHIDLALYGGKKGYEFTLHLLKKLKHKCAGKKAYFVLSSLSSIEEFLRITPQAKILMKQKLSFETLYCLRVKL